MTEEEQKKLDRRLEKLSALSTIRKALMDGNTWAGKTLHQSICLLDDVISEEIRKL